MNFGEPWWLWELAGVGVFALILLLFAIGSRTGAGRGVRWPRIARVVASRAGVRPVRAGRTVRRPWFLLLAICTVVIALARPQWGKIDEPVVEQAREVMIALDLSRSMLVQDVPPSRLERAKLLTKSLLDNLRGERVGVTVFAGTAFVQVPLSADYQIIHDFLPDLQPDFMPQGGTDYDGMLRSALAAFGDESEVDRFLIVLSDGESHTAKWRDHLPEMRERNVRALTLGIGTPAGGFIPDGEKGFLKDERGAVVLSKLEPATLQALANDTRGVFRNASDWVDLSALLETTVARGQAGRFATRRNERYLERFQWFLAPAVALAMLGLWREIAVRPRQQTVRRAATTVKPATSLAAALTMVCLLAPPLPAADQPKADDAPQARVRETITRLARSSSPTARDWRELADRTLVYATGARMNQQPVEPGAVHDALAAVDLGEKADPKLTDWNKLRNDLRATLDLPPQQQEQKKPDEPPPEEKKEEKEQDEQQQEKQDQSQQQEQDSQQQASEQNQEQQDRQQQQEQQQQQSQEGKEPAKANQQEGEMGDLQSEPGEPQPPASPGENTGNPPKTRKIGAKPATEQPPPTDAETAVLLQRLRQAAENDSPALLFQLLEGDDKKPAERGKDW